VKIAGVGIGVAMVVGLWAFFAPVELGGSTSYSITSGISMQPILYKNDLAIVRAQSSYHVGEIVLYQSPVLHRPVLHRIIMIRNGDYYFKGDNNDFVDPGYATRAELSGSLWFEIPKVGAVLGWFGTPLHAALLAGLAALGVALTGITTKRKRRRRRRRKTRFRGRRDEQLTIGEVMVDDSTERSSSDGAPRRDVIPAPASGARDTDAVTPAPPMVLPAPTGPAPTAAVVARGPGVTAALTCLFAALALLFLGLGFSRPLYRVVPLSGAYQQSGRFSYTAATKAPTPVYPSGFVTTGEPIYPSLVDSVALRFSYRFSSAMPHHITGTIMVNALLLSQTNTWQRLTVIRKRVSFTGDRVSVVSSLPLNGLYTLISSVSTQSGVEGVAYTADIQPIVHLSGTVGKEGVHDTFSPVLPFTISQTTIAVNAPAAAAPPGATYAPSSATAALASALHPVQAGSIPHVVANEVSVAKYDLPVPALRWLGLSFVGLALVLGVLHDVLRRRMAGRSVEDLIASRLHSRIVPVAVLTEPGEPVVVPDFSDLAGLAEFLEQPILCEVSDGQRTYAVDDDAHRYVYRPPKAPASDPDMVLTGGGPTKVV
jgi:signal peptidase I